MQSLTGDNVTPGAGGPLAEVTVLEIGSFLAGPFAGQLLGDYGADVIKVEPLEGDPMRRWGVCIDDSSLWWPTIARNKRCVSIDLHHDEGRDIVRRIATRCDILIEIRCALGGQPWSRVRACVGLRTDGAATARAWLRQHR